MCAFCRTTCCSQAWLNWSAALKLLKVIYTTVLGFISIAIKECKHGKCCLKKNNNNKHIPHIPTEFAPARVEPNKQGNAGISQYKTKLSITGKKRFVWGVKQQVKHQNKKYFRYLFIVRTVNISCRPSSFLSKSWSTICLKQKKMLKFF